MLALSAPLVASFQAPLQVAHGSRVSVTMDALSDLKSIAKESNPVIGYYDPLSAPHSRPGLAHLRGALVLAGEGHTSPPLLPVPSYCSPTHSAELTLPRHLRTRSDLGSWNLWGTGSDATIGFLRHSELKHGRVAMAAFVGYIVHENGIRWPTALSTSLPDYSSFEGLSAPAVWDAIPLWSKLQIFGAIAFLEAWSETSAVLKAEGQSHYMRGGKPGYFPTFDLSQKSWGIPHPVPLNLYDPLGFSTKRTAEQKEKGLITELNNGRLAMIGIFGFISEATVPGSVPGLTGLVKPYDGDVMAPFAGNLDGGIAAYLANL